MIQSMINKYELLKEYTKIESIGLKCLFTAITLIVAAFTYKQRFYSTIILISAIFGCLFVPYKYRQGKFTHFWGAIFGVSLLYALSFIYMLFHTQKEVINILTTKIDPSLKLIEYTQISYAQSCNFLEGETSFSQKLIDTLDVFALGHFLGWFSKAIIIRDFKLLMFASISFEAIEFSLRNVLNNFKECWWDHIIVDIAVFNLLGIICGFIYLDWRKQQRYRWSLRSAPLKYSCWQNFKIFFREVDLSNFQIKVVSSLSNFLKISFFIVLLFTNDLTIFFLKYIYRIPPPHFLNFMRCLFGFLCMKAISEYYQWLQGKQKIHGIYLYLLSSILILEVAAIFRHKEDTLNHAFIDGYGKTILAIYAVIFLVLLVKVTISDLYSAIYKQKDVIEPSSKLLKHSDQGKQAN